MGIGIIVAEAAQRIRYNFGTTGGEISGERACKRRSAKHLEFLPSLLEGRRSIQLSYGASLATHLILLELQNQFDSRFFRNLGALWSNWNLKADADRSRFSQTKVKFFVQAGIQFGHRLWSVSHPRIIYILLNPFPSQPRLAKATETMPTHSRFIDSHGFETGSELSFF